jgi:hypothetical protein
MEPPLLFPEEERENRVLETPFNAARAVLHRALICLEIRYHT